MVKKKETITGADDKQPAPNTVNNSPHEFSEGQEVLLKGGSVGKVLKIITGKTGVRYVVSQITTVEADEGKLSAV